MKKIRNTDFIKANVLFVLYLILGMAIKSSMDKWDIPLSQLFIIFVPFFASFATVISYQNYLKAQLNQSQRRLSLYNFYFLSLLFKLIFINILFFSPALTQNGETDIILNMVQNKLDENPVAISFIVISFLISDFILVFLGIVAAFLMAPKLFSKVQIIKEKEFWHPTTHFVYLFALLYIGLKAILFIIPEEFITPYLGYVFVLLASMTVVSVYYNSTKELDKKNEEYFKRHLWLASIFIDLPVLVYLGLVAKNFHKSSGVTEAQSTFIDMYSGDFIYMAIALIILGNYFLISLSFIFVRLGGRKLFAKSKD